MRLFKFLLMAGFLVSLFWLNLAVAQDTPTCPLSEEDKCAACTVLSQAAIYLPYMYASEPYTIPSQQQCGFAFNLLKKGEKGQEATMSCKQFATRVLRQCKRFRKDAQQTDVICTSLHESTKNVCDQAKTDSGIKLGCSIFGFLAFSDEEIELILALKGILSEPDPKSRKNQAREIRESSSNSIIYNTAFQACQKAACCSE